MPWVSAGLPSGVWTRVGVGLLAAVIALGAGTLGAAPARAADLGTVTVTGAAGPYASSPGSLTGAVGDTFRVVDATTGVPPTVNVGTTAGVDTGSVSVGAQACGAPGSQATCIASRGAGTTYTITELGTISITYTSGGSQAPIGPILLQAAGGGSADPKVVYPFLTLNPNGGTCSGTLEFNAIPGTGNDSVTLPTSSTSTRSGYELSGWAYNADGTGTVLTPGIEVATGSTTLYAVWQPNGVQITYDANVGMSKECFAGGVIVTTAANRRATSVVQLGSSSATTAPCTPVGSRLAGWAYTGNGSVAFTAGQSLPATFASGSSVTLFAKWETVYGLSASPSSVKFSPGGSAVVTFTATVNGAPAPGSAVELRTSGDPVSLSPGPSVAATTDNAGKVSVTITKPSAGKATVTAAFGDKTATVDVSIPAKYALGDIGPGGGLVFLISGGLVYEMAPKDWGNEETGIRWCSNQINSVSTGTAVGTGSENTTKMLTSAGAFSACTVSAPNAARAYRGGGQSDWFLPSKDELNAMCIYSRDPSAPPTGVSCSVAGSQDAAFASGDYGFAAGKYWSSSQNDADNAWRQNFDGGNQKYGRVRSVTLRVRPVRAFPAKYALGDIGPGGGRVFLISGGLTYEMAPNDWGANERTGIRWCSDRTNSVSTGKAVGTGRENTTAMLTSAGAFSACTGSAPNAARAYRGGGQSDWFLPSKDELNAMCNYSRNPSAPPTGVCHGRQNAAFARGDYGFARVYYTDYYWSSSQTDATAAWNQGFVDGYQANGSEGLTLRVRPVRAF